jgi:multidrug efflux pump
MFYVLLRALSGNRPLTQHGEGSMTPPAPEHHPAKEAA